MLCYAARSFWINLTLILHQGSRLAKLSSQEALKYLPPAASSDWKLGLYSCQSFHSCGQIHHDSADFLHAHDISINKKNKKNPFQMGMRNDTVVTVVYSPPTHTHNLKVAISAYSPDLPGWNCPCWVHHCVHRHGSCFLCALACHGS